MEKQFRIILFAGALVAGLGIFEAFKHPDTSKLSPEQLTIAEGEDEDEPLSLNGCGGVERWDVKVMTDTAAYRLVLTPIQTSVFHLATLNTPVPDEDMPRYNPVEDSVYTTICTVIAKMAEPDSDYHLIITDGILTMIAEVPDPDCISVAASPYVNDFIAARKWVDSVIGKGSYYSLNIKNVAVTGQAFIDPPHGQDGAAPNNLEVHSVIKIQFYNPLAIGSISASEGLNIYPNPSNGIYNISMPASRGNERVEVYTVTGEKIFETIVDSKRAQINIMGRAQGVYIYKIMDEYGEFISAGKLLVNK